jgi:hypothetical protein
MLCKAKTSAVITFPDGSLLPVGKGKIVDLPEVVYNSCWELFDKLADQQPSAPKVAEPKIVRKDIAHDFESAAIEPSEKAVSRKPRKRKL